MAMQHNTDHIQTTHIGSLPRPHKLLDILKAKYGRQPYDEAELNSTLTQAVAGCVRNQVECGIEIVTDGEYSKPGFFTYIRERFGGFGSWANQKLGLFQKEGSSFPGYYFPYFKEAMMGGAILPIVPVVCIGPVKYKGEEKLQTDIANVKAAAKAAKVPDHHLFLPATAPSGVGINEYYKDDEQYFHALATELNKEYRAIIAAGILLQVDDPFLPDIFVEPGLDESRRSGERRFMLKQRMRRSAAFPPSAFAFTRATALMRDPASTNRICRKSSNTFSRSMPVLSASKLRTRGMNTNITCSSA